uniref:alpha/beta hydrolase n=1 Tax=Nocardia stercoris TaxID=2483361 RepID=UPI003898D896
MIRFPICVILGVAAAFAARQYMADEGLASDPAPVLLWVCVGGTAAAIAVAVVGWPRTRWWHRLAAVLAIPLTAASSLVVLNQWVGYYPTWQAAWSAFTAGPLPHQTDMAQLAGMRDTDPATGVIVPVDIPDDASGFKHRTEYVYLPPAYFHGATAPTLPVVMMIAGEFNTPADWVRSGQIMPVIDKFTRANNGQAPILVFPDSSGSFNNDTECVDGPRGRAAAHLTDDVVPYVESTFNAAKDPAHWAVIGWSMGGTCAVDLTVMHPELFHTFVDIAGDLGPASGTKEQTIRRLYGGDAAKWAAFDPQTVMAAHGLYTGVTGLFDDLTPPKVPAGTRVPGVQTAPDGTVTGFDPDAYAAGQADGPKASGNDAPQPGPGTPNPGADLPRMPQGFRLPKVPESQVGIGGQDGNGFDTGEFGAAEKLCTEGRAVGIDCTVHTSKGGHTWQFAAAAFGSAFPWVVASVGLPVPAN